MILSDWFKENVEIQILLKKEEGLKSPLTRVGFFLKSFKNIYHKLCKIISG
jgi:hypothetical protein